MAIENITREEFELYKSIQAKRHEIQKYKTENDKQYLLAAGWGAGFVVTAGAATLLGISGMLPGLAIFGGVGSLGYFVNLYDKIKSIQRNLGMLSGLEKEVEELESQSAYKSLE